MREKIGFYYEVTEEQVRQHQKRNIKDILIWLEETAKFIWMVQTPEERERMKKAKNMKW